jgi:SHS2 domain-containing protein
MIVKPDSQEEKSRGTVGSRDRWRWVDDGETVNLHLKASSLIELLADAAMAIGERVKGSAVGEPDRLPVLVNARDLPGVVGGFIDDLLFLAEAEHFATNRVERLQLDDTRLRAAVSGHTGSTSSFAEDTTYPNVVVELVDDDWTACVVFRPKEGA